MDTRCVGDLSWLERGCCVVRELLWRAVVGATAFTILAITLPWITFDKWLADRQKGANP